MKKLATYFALQLIAVLMTSISALGQSEAIVPLQPYGPVPSERQTKWHEMEFYGMMHFGLNTFMNQEWGFGDVPPDVFNPVGFDADQIVGSMKAAGIKGVILICKHHDGFCLWPSQFTDYSVKSSPWRGGKGDLVKEVSDACHKRGMKFGVYLSAWDRHRADYGTSEYLDFYRKQLHELLTNYGEVFMVWFDGAQGGSGFYGGSRDVRKVDNRTYYEWPKTWAMVRDLQPRAVIFSDGGPDVRWAGNESGIAGEPNWCTLNADDFFPGIPDYQSLLIGQRTGKQWVPEECNVSLRPGWFYHAKEDQTVKTLDRLEDIYFRTVGRGACLDINVSPNTNGVLCAGDVAVLKSMGQFIQDTFATNIASNAKLTASNVRANEKRFRPENLISENRDLYWTTDDGVRTAQLTIDLAHAVELKIIRLREFLPLGQRIEGFSIDTWENEKWVESIRGTSIGSQRLLRFKPTVKTARLRVRITKSAESPALSELAVFGTE